MRLILSFLALANVRWAKADLMRSQRLTFEAEAAYASAHARMTQAGVLTDRARALR